MKNTLLDLMSVIFHGTVDNTSVNWNPNGDWNYLLALEPAPICVSPESGKSATEVFDTHGYVYTVMGSLP